MKEEDLKGARSKLGLKGEVKSKTYEVMVECGELSLLLMLFPLTLKHKTSDATPCQMSTLTSGKTFCLSILTNVIFLTLSYGGHVTVTLWFFGLFHGEQKMTYSLIKNIWM